MASQPSLSDLLREKAHVPARAPQAPIPDDESPFGEDLPSTGPLPSKGFGRVTGRKGGNSSVREHYPRVIKHLVEGNVPQDLVSITKGGFYWKCDHMEATYIGKIVAVDLLGFMDVQGLKEGQFIAVQITSKAAMGAHVRSYINPLNTHGQGKKVVRELIREFLAQGGVFLIAGYHRPKETGPWLYEWWVVDEALLAEFEARRKGPKPAKGRR